MSYGDFTSHLGNMHDNFHEVHFLDFQMANSLYAKLSPVSTRRHQPQPGHMTEKGKKTTCLSHAPVHVCFTLSWCQSWTLRYRPALCDYVRRTKVGVYF